MLTSRGSLLIVQRSLRFLTAPTAVMFTSRARHWLEQVSGGVTDLFGELRMLRRVSNGEAIFERSRSACTTGS